MAQRCGLCGKTEKQHKGKACFDMEGFKRIMERRKVCESRNSGEAMKTDEQRFPADGRGILCGHNFPPRQCPYAKCGYRETLERLEKCEAVVRKVADLSDKVAWTIDDEWPFGALMSKNLAKIVGDMRIAARAAMEGK